MLKKYHAFYLAVIICATSLSASEVEVPILNDKVLSKIGYRTADIHYDSGLCNQYEKPLIITEKEQYQGIKSRKEMKGYKNTYYRFTLILEEYQTKEQAESRLNQMEYPHSFETDSWYSKNCGLKGGFIYKNKVYSLVTDAGLFSGEITPLLALIKEEIIDGKK